MRKMGLEASRALRERYEPRTIQTETKDSKEADQGREASPVSHERVGRQGE